MTPPPAPRSGMDSERFMILQMVQDRTISPDEGSRLLETIDRLQRSAPTPPAPPVPVGPRNVRIIVTNAKGDAEVDVNLPFGLVEMGLSMASKFAPDKVPDLTEVRKSVREGFTGSLLNINNGTDHIEIIIEER